jgi:hypothetical protein
MKGRSRSASAATAARRPPRSRRPSPRRWRPAAHAGRRRAVASIDLKADEPGLLRRRRGTWLDASTSTRRAELAAVDVPNPSETVRKHTGTPSVSEAAALLAAGADKPNLIIEKHKLRGPDGRNATVSIARIPNDASPPPASSTGKIMLVGLGPGSHDHLTAAPARPSPRPTR